MMSQIVQNLINIVDLILGNYPDKYPSNYKKTKQNF